MPAERAPVAVEVAGLTTSFDEVRVLDDVSLRVPAGAMVALLGPSGCGKTTLLRAIAGLVAVDAGQVRVGDRVLTGDGVAVPPERRQVGMVFQDWALFPHLSVARNVAYGLGGDQRADTDRRVDDALAMVGLAGLGDRLPGTLSGGQQQRVALARALAPEPAVLLLDEPFSNLDAALRAQVRTEVHALLVRLGITTIVVTHDQEEAFVLGDEVAVLSAGRIVQHAAPTTIYERPATPWVAGFVGETNVLAGRFDPTSGVASTALGSLAVDLDDDGQASVGDGGPVDVLVRPEQLRFDPAGPTSGVIELVEYHGHDTMYVVAAAGLELRVRVAGTAPLARGSTVGLRVVADRVRAFPRAGD